MDDPGFGSLNDAHDELEAVFGLHQECLVAGELHVALEVLRVYRAMLAVHIRHEEELVMPLYARAKAPRWPEELYTGQHQKLLALLDRAGHALGTGRKTWTWRRTVIEALDVQSTFKNLVEHHHLAEDEVFYPTAAAESSEEELARIAEVCAAQWAEAVAAGRDVVERARAALDAIDRRA